MKVPFKIIFILLNFFIFVFVANTSANGQASDSDINALLNKWKSLNVATSILKNNICIPAEPGSRFTTRNPNITVVEFVDMLGKGGKRVYKRGDTWIIEQNVVDDMTGEKIQYLWGFQVLSENYRQLFKCDFLASRFLENGREMSLQALHPLVDGYISKRLLQSFAEKEKTNKGIEYMNLALMQRDNGQYEQALDSIDKAMELLPDNIQLFVIKGGIYLRQSDLKNATKFYESGLRLIKKDSNANQYNLASGCAIMLDKFKDAETYSNEALKLNSSSWWIYVTLGHVYLLQNKKEDAMKVYGIAFENATKKVDVSKRLINDFNIYKIRYPDKEPLITWARQKLELPEFIPEETKNKEQTTVTEPAKKTKKEKKRRTE